MSAHQTISVEDIRVDAVVIGERLRPLSETAVEELADSFKRIGQIQPITVNRLDGVPRLVTGHHRLIAARRLGLESIASVILPIGTTDDDCLQIEIAENLHRNDLTKEERDRHIRLLADLIARKDAAESDGKETTHNASFSESGAGGPGRGHKSVATRVAEQVGLSKDTVRRAMTPEAEKAKKAAVKEQADRAEAHAEAKRKREAEQAEHDRQREDTRAGLSPEIQAMEAAKQDRARKAAPSEDRIDALTAEVDELRDANAALEADLAAARAENALYADMKVEWEKGGFAEVIRGLEHQIDVLGRQVETISEDRAAYLGQAKRWRKRAIDSGYSSEEVIELRGGAHG